MSLRYITWYRSHRLASIVWFIIMIANWSSSLYRVNSSSYIDGLPCFETVILHFNRRVFIIPVLYFSRSFLLEIINWHMLQLLEWYDILSKSSVIGPSIAWLIQAHLLSLDLFTYLIVVFIDLSYVSFLLVVLLNSLIVICPHFQWPKVYIGLSSQIWLSTQIWLSVLTVVKLWVLWLLANCLLVVSI